MRVAPTGRIPHSALRTPHLQSNRDARVRNSPGKINRAINRIDYPSLLGLDVSSAAFLAENRGVWEGRTQNLLNPFLATNIKLQSDVVPRRFINLLCFQSMLTHQYAGCARGLG